MEARSARLRSIEEENLTWKTKMRQYYDDTLTAMLTMYEKRLLTDRESFDTINEQVRLFFQWVEEKNMLWGEGRTTIFVWLALTRA